MADFDLNQLTAALEANPNLKKDLVSWLQNRAQTNPSDNLFKMFNGNTALNWNVIDPSSTPGFFDKMFGYSQNGQNYMGWGGAALQGIENIASAWQAYNQYRSNRDLARDQFNLQKRQYEDGYANTMEDRRIRAASRASANS